MKRVRTASRTLRLGLAVALAVIALVAALPAIAPNPVPASAPESNFSAQRAMEDLRVVAREPHPMGSAAQARVRDYILAQADAFGLPAEVQRAEVAGGRTTENVVVRLPGMANSARDVLIAAHYDSATSAPGAGDAGVSVVAMLETMRALEAGEPLKNDIVFLFTDGEEQGVLGAKAFVNGHPAAQRVGVAFVFDSEPDSGPTEMQKTSPGDAWLVGQLVAASPPVYTNSAYNTSDRARLGNDFSAFPPAGILSAEFLTHGGVVRYHTSRDTVGAINPAVVQDHGDTMLSLARHFGNLDLGAARSASEDLVFFTVPMLGLVAYPVWFARVLAVVAAVLFAAVIVAARRRGRLSLARLGLGALASLAVVVVGVTLAWAAWEQLLSMHPESSSTLHFPDFEGSGVAMAAIYAVAVVAFVAVAHLLSRPIGGVELAAGALVWWVVLDLAIAFFEPLFSTLTLWPLFGGVAALAVVVLFLRRGWAAGVLLALAAVPGPVLVVPLLVIKAIKVEDGALLPVVLLLLLLGSLLLQLLLITGRVAPKAEDSTRSVSGADGRTEDTSVRTDPPPSGRMPRLSGDARSRDA
ncbi:MAG TPA: M20/M25/M40 family metallo-hydrolase [Rubrobacteraceae bacterium]|nr:M20/M25/M40 family metallo-hydrolase [Rubrobacteraceae bacterium]